MYHLHFDEGQQSMDPKACNGCGATLPPSVSECPACGRAESDEGGVFRLFSDAGEKVLAECPKCGRVLTILRDRASTTDDGYLATGGFRCPCGFAGQRISKKAPKGPSRSGSSKVRCPKCRSEQIAGGRKGFGLGKAAVGGLLDCLEPLEGEITGTQCPGEARVPRKPHHPGEPLRTGAIRVFPNQLETEKPGLG